MNEAANLAVRREVDRIQMHDFSRALEEAVQRSATIRSFDERERTRENLSNLFTFPSILTS